MKTNWTKQEIKSMEKIVFEITCWKNAK